MLSEPQIKLVAETLSNIGVVFFASLVVPIFFSTEINVGIVIVGFSLAVTAWFCGLLIIKSIKI